MRLIGIYGKMGSGKSIVSEAMPSFIRSMYGKTLNIHYCSISSNLKRIVSDITGVTPNDNLMWIDMYNSCDYRSDYSQLQKSTPIPHMGNKTIGTILQDVGLSQKKSNGENVWIDSAIRSIPAGTDIVIMDGIRYRSDILAIKKIGGTVIKVAREFDSEYAGFRNSEHVSETELDSYRNFLFTVQNKNLKTHNGYNPSAIRCAAVNQMINRLCEMHSTAFIDFIEKPE